MERMRLDKFLATYTSLSRKDAKKTIRQGVVVIDGTVVKSETEKVSLEQDVFLHGERIHAKQHIYLMFNKPQGVLSATKDQQEKTVLDFVTDVNRELFPVGRLDKDTEGFLLLTDDGELAHRLLSPAYHVAKTYYLEYTGTLVEDAIQRVADGIEIGEKNPTRPAVLHLLESGKAELTITEGKFHQVKRMIAALGGKVIFLKRIAMAGIMLDSNLALGEYRELTSEELILLHESTKERKR